MYGAAPIYNTHKLRKRCKKVIEIRGQNGKQSGDTDWKFLISISSGSEKLGKPLTTLGDNTDFLEPA